MPTRERQSLVTDNESKNDGSMHLILQWDWSTRQRLWYVDIYTVAKTQNKSLHGSHLLCGFCGASGFEECKTLPQSDNADFTSLNCAGSNEQYG